MTEPTLTVQQAFQAMRHFLEQFNEREHSESIVLLLDWMTQGTWADPQMTADPAQWHDWLASVERALSGSDSGD
jgi:hypothetical protein